MADSTVWTRERAATLPADSTVIAALASAVATTVWDEPSCGHVYEVGSCRISVTRVAPGGDGSPAIICGACYEAVRSSDRIARRGLEPVLHDEPCFMCGLSEAVRRSADLGVGVCDACILQSAAAESAAELRRGASKAVDPDILVPGILYIGPKEAASSLEVLARHRISRVLVCCDSLTAHHTSAAVTVSDHDAPDAAGKPAGGGGLRYHRLPLADSLAQGLGAYLPSALAFIAQGALAGERTLVHCNAGVSRSGAIAVEWLRRTAHLPLADAIAAAKVLRPCVTPNSNFVQQLAALEAAEAPPTSGGSSP